MARRHSGRGRGKGKQGPSRWVALGVAGALGLGLAIKARDPGAGTSELALSAPAPETAGEPRGPAEFKGAPGGTGGASAGARGPAPEDLQAAYGKLDDPSLHPLLDLRRLAVEHSDARAARTLSDVAQRSLAAARQPGAQPEHALRAMTRAYVATISARERRALRPEAEALSASALTQNSAFFSEYTVQKGDALTRIARRLKVDYRAIKRYSGLKSDSLKIGQKLRIPQVATELFVFKGDFELVILLDGCLVRAFDVATGKNGKTPEGRFVIGTKTVNPTWYSPDGKVYKFGSEENILGTRWLAFENTDEHQGFGIHGTKFPDSIGTEASMGCLRMRNADAEVVFDYVPSGTKIRIVK